MYMYVSLRLCEALEKVIAAKPHYSQNKMCLLLLLEAIGFQLSPAETHKQELAKDTLDIIFPNYCLPHKSVSYTVTYVMSRNCSALGLHQKKYWGVCDLSQSSLHPYSSRSAVQLLMVSSYVFIGHKFSDHTSFHCTQSPGNYLYHCHWDR